MSATQSHNTQNKSSSFSLIKRLAFDYLLPYRFQVTIAIFFMALAAAMTALIALLMQPVLDDVLVGKKMDLIIPVALALSLTFAVRGVSTYIHSVFMSRVGFGIVADVQKHLFSYLMYMDMAFFHANPSGQILSRVVNDVMVMRTTVAGTLTGFGKSFFSLIFLVGVMFYQDWKLTLAAFVIFPLLSFFVIYIGKRLRKISKNTQKYTGGLSDVLSQVFLGVRLVKAYGAEEREIDRVGEAIDKVRGLNIKAARVSALSTPVNEIIVGVIFAAIIIYGGYEVIAGRTSAGQLASFIAAFTLAYEPMKRLAKLNNTLQIGLGATERVFDFIDRQRLIADKEDAQALDIGVSDITFEDVHFSYEGADVPALNGFSLCAKAGKVTALVGASGGGKSTVLNLIPRFYDVDRGVVKIGDFDVRDVTQKSLRAHMAVVSQEITIFNESVFDNIRYGREDATDEEVYAAAKAAAAHDFIDALDDGYDTILGEQGVKLSGGQRQRIAIARAILRDAPILLLDEATSALDNESEKLVQAALLELQKGRTTIVIAHRLTTVQEADHIVAMEHGRVVEEGTHQDLIDKRGVYEGMYRTGMSY